MVSISLSSLSLRFAKGGKISTFLSMTTSRVEANPLIPLGSGGRNSSFVKDDHEVEGHSALDITTTTGWNWQLYLLLFNGVISTCWGITLVVLAWPGGVLPLHDSWGDNPAVTNTIVALIAATSTMHLRYIIQRLVEEYTHCLMVDGFTASHLRWLQKVQSISVFIRFTGKRRQWLTRQLLWTIVYAGLAVHTSSFVSIFQIRTTPFLNGGSIIYALCPVGLANLTLGEDPSLSQDLQSQFDSGPFFVGMQLGTYVNQLHQQTSFAPRLNAQNVYFTKDNYAYGPDTGRLPGYLSTILLDTPGVQFRATCTVDPDEAVAVWHLAFPNLSPPTVIILPDGFLNFTNITTPPQMQSVFSGDGPFNVSQNILPMYALVGPSGSGALLHVDVPTSTGKAVESNVVCSWKTLPLTLHIQSSNFTYTVDSVGFSDKYPSAIGRSTLKTLEGMAKASSSGANLLVNEDSIPYNDVKSVADMLEKILADGGKVGLTTSNSLNSALGNSNNLCHYVARLMQPYKRFANLNGFGWIAALWTVTIGIYTIIATKWMSGRRRMGQISILDVPDAFALGRGEALKKNQIFCLRDGRISQL